MPGNRSGQDSLVIESQSGDESFLVHMRLHGTYGVRCFLDHLGIDERQIALAIEKLGHSGQAAVKRSGLTNF